MSASSCLGAAFQNMDFLPLGILVLDTEFRVCFWNACLESWAGLDRSAVLGKDAAALFPQLARPLVATRLRDVFRGGPPAVFSYHLHNHMIPSPLPGGANRLQHTVAYGLRGADGDVTHAVLSLQDVTEIHTRLRENLRIQAELERENKLRRRVEKKLRELATRDMLTGVANRRSFLVQLGREVRRAQRHGHPLCLMAADLDHFKAINDTWGHQTGDELLKAFAAACKRQLRDFDSLGRVGGEEFGVILPETSPDGALVPAERIREAVREIALPNKGGRVSMTVSIGLTCLKPGQDLKQFLNAADQAMYRAKAAGRDRVVTDFG
jgi:diguanylate cyclase (GGDEF)-like protein